MTGPNKKGKEPREPLALSVHYGIPVWESRPLTGRLRPDVDICTIIDKMDMAGPQATESVRGIN